MSSQATDTTTADIHGPAFYGPATKAQAASSAGGYVLLFFCFFCGPIEDRRHEEELLQEGNRATQSVRVCEGSLGVACREA